MNEPRRIHYWGYAILYYICINVFVHLIKFILNHLFPASINPGVDLSIIVAASIPCSLAALTLIDKLFYRKRAQHINYTVFNKIAWHTVYVQSILIILFAIPFTVAFTHGNIILFLLLFLFAGLIVMNGFTLVIMKLSFNIFRTTLTKRKQRH